MPPFPNAPIVRRRHPIRWIVLFAVLAYIAYGIYDYNRPASSLHPTLQNPDGQWVGEITMDGRYYHPPTDGDTPGQHRFGVVFFTLETTNGFLDHHAGDGTLRIAGEGIKRPIRAYGWPAAPDGTLSIGFNSSPQIFSSEFSCDAEGTALTCKSTDNMKPRLVLRPGTVADAQALYNEALRKEANEPPLTPLPHGESMQEFEDRMHKDEEETDRMLGRKVPGDKATSSKSRKNPSP